MYCDSLLDEYSTAIIGGFIAGILVYFFVIFLEKYQRKKRKNATLNGVCFYVARIKEQLSGDEPSEEWINIYRRRLEFYSGKLLFISPSSLDGYFMDVITALENPYDGKKPVSFTSENILKSIDRIIEMLKEDKFQKHFKDFEKDIKNHTLATVSNIVPLGYR